MLVVGVVGSPRKGGLTTKLVGEALAGAEEAGAATRLIYLIDYEVRPWTPESPRAPEELNEVMRGADGYVIGAPVYYLDVNGLTKDFMDTVDLGDSNGKPGLGIAVAGGTGKGLVLAVKSIYYFFFCKGIRPLEPLPVSRFNFEDALRRARELGRELAEAARERRPFRSLEERIRCFNSLRYMRMDMLDEILLLAEQLLKASPKREYLEEAKACYERAKRLAGEGRRSEAVKYAVRAYELLYY
ncbi:MAG: hypothetical protein DRJ96_02565 [Thermoprotei archaeon]|nr:MAG: hypothetical protein DRJ96_02565 [Thermoprotei archaeon]